MVRKLNNALNALETIMESLLMSYRYDAAEGVTCFILDYWDKDAGADRAFVRFRFGGVSSFQRLKGEYAGLQSFTDSFSLRETRMSPVVENISIDIQDKFIRIRFWFASGFGGVLFECQWATAEVRNMRVIETAANESDYYDFYDGAKVDFYDPFA